LPLAEGIKMARPELHVFVITSEADCCGVGAAHWIHALRHNMNLTVIVQGLHAGARPRQQAARVVRPRHGAVPAPINPLSVSLGVPGASFIAQAVDWIPELLDDIVHAAFKHRGLSFVRWLHRASFASSFDPWLHDPQRCLLLTHADGLQPSSAVSSIYRNQRVHDPADIEGARAIAAQEGTIPVGILYRNPAAPCYEDLRHAAPLRAPEFIRAGLARELDRTTVWPVGDRV
jgi:2-oxoglutarate ferredoxin oxidoreductase subunit beta